MTAIISPFAHGPVTTRRIGKLVFALAPARSGLERLAPPLVHDDDGAITLLDGWLAAEGDPVLSRAQAAREPDVARVHRLWRRSGATAAARLHGSFALVHCPPANEVGGERVWLCRDGGSHRPLYFVHLPGRLIAFATQPKMLLALPGVRGDLDEDIVLAALADHKALPTEAMPYADLRRVPSAHWVCLSAQGVDMAPYWTPRDRPPPAGFSDDDYVAAGRDLLDRVVGDYARGPGPVAVALSGGLDSQAIASSLLLHTSGPVHGYARLPPIEHQTRTNAATFADERPGVDSLAARYPRLVVHAITRRGVKPGDEVLRETQRATALWSPASLFQCSQMDINLAASADGMACLLTGIGGNQTLSWRGDDRFESLVAAGAWPRLLWELAACGRVNGLGRLRQVVGALAPDRLRRLIGRPRKPFPRVGFGRFLSHEALARLGRIPGDLGAATDGLGARHRRLVMAGVDSFFLDVDALDARRLGLERGDPLADRRMVDFFLSVPADQCLRHGRDRWLARRILADRLAPEVVWRPRLGDQLVDIGPRAEAWRPGLSLGIERLRGSRLARRLLDLDRMAEIAGADWPANIASDRQSYATVASLAAAVQTGGFLHMIDGAND
ncbi:asparagine synthetase B family protein [Rhodospirillum rubrum]|uniref:asparagine synthetase B family protein n=1 Tax=Rhodospirillum rubrum TaxID=1085 RepID=UPI0027DAEA47|nr:asparagine synthetase B family protein [Rhodospirillum rubrum]